MSDFDRIGVKFLFVFIINIIIYANAGVAQLSIETRAMTGTDGELGPALGAGIAFQSISEPVLTDAGQVLFNADLIGPSITRFNKRGIWSDIGGGSLGTLVRNGEQAPGVEPGSDFSSFTGVLNGSGQVSLLGVLTGPEVDSFNEYGIWRRTPTGFELIARRGSQAPGVEPGDVYFGIGNNVINGSGRIVFNGSLAGPGISDANRYGIWSSRDGADAELIVRTGQQVPGESAGVTFSSVGSPLVNDHGAVLFAGSLDGPGFNSFNNSGIWAHRPDTGTALVVRAGDSAPGTASGVTFSAINNPRINNAGNIAFTAAIAGAGVSGTNNGGIWSDGGGAGLGLVARTGDVAPGTDRSFSGFRSLALNGAGQAGFLARLDGPGLPEFQDSGIWLESKDAGLGLVALEGEQAPGVEAGVTFSELDAPVLNGVGQLAFLSKTRGPGDELHTGVGIWATDRDGALRLIVRSGEQIDVSSDPSTQDLRIVSTLRFESESLLIGSGEDGRSMSFNNSGQLAFHATFLDGTEGVFVATVPEPASFFILGIAGAWACCRRRG